MLPKAKYVLIRVNQSEDDSTGNIANFTALNWYRLMIAESAAKVGLTKYKTTTRLKSAVHNGVEGGDFLYS